MTFVLWLSSLRRLTEVLWRYPACGMPAARDGDDGSASLAFMS